jgi:uncharacterized protein with von Willebrand factor type A (vWA) domain
VSTPALLRGVDLAAFAVALVARLRGAGVSVSASGQTTFVRALQHLAPGDRSSLYWAARLSLVNRMDELGTFDAVFAAVFGTGAPDGRDSPSLPLPGPRTPAAGIVHRGGNRPSAATQTLPWATGVVGDSDGEAAVGLPEFVPSRMAALTDEPFDRFDPEDLRLLGAWLRESLPHWPTRRSLRSEPSSHGRRIDLRATIDASRTTGWETITLARTRPRRRPRRVVLVCDVSRSMQPFAAVYLHLMRAVMMRQTGIRPEVFAFSTSLTRLTTVLSHRSTEAALERANARVTDRYGGTFIGRSINGLLAAPHGNALRGAIVIIASDGWDSDPPEVLERALLRLRRRAHRLVWLNPRAAQPDYRPLTGSMATALPYCDLFLPGHTLAGLQQVLWEITQPVARPASW